MKMEKEVREKVEEDANKMQRDFYLRKQMEDDSQRTRRIRRRRHRRTGKPSLPRNICPIISARRSTKSSSACVACRKAPTAGGMEAGQIRNWLELIVELPWEDPQKREISLTRAEQVLNEDHEGLEEVKKRINRISGGRKSRPSAVRRRSCAWSDLPASVRRVSRARSPGPSGVRSCVRLLAGCATKRRFADIAGPTWALCRVKCYRP